MPANLTNHSNLARTVRLPPSTTSTGTASIDIRQSSLLSLARPRTKNHAFNKCTGMNFYANWSSFESINDDFATLLTHSGPKTRFYTSANNSESFMLFRRSLAESVDGTKHRDDRRIKLS